MTVSPDQLGKSSDGTDPVPDESILSDEIKRVVPAEERLQRGSSKEEWLSQILVGYEDRKKPGAEILESLIVVGGSTLAIIRRNRRDGKPGAEQVRISVLGNFGDDEPRDVANFNLDEMMEPGEDGAIQSWREVHVGRGMVNPLDKTISRTHFSFRLDANGKYTITDRSTNGTIVFGEKEFMKASARANTQYERDQLGGIVQKLENNPELWHSPEQ